MGATPADCRIERTTCWCLPGTFEALLSRRWWLSRKNCYWRWNLGPLPPTGNQASEQGMAPYLPKTEKILHPTICGKGYADSLLGCTRGNVISEHYMPRGNTTTSAKYADLKNHLCPAIKSKRRGLLSTGVLLQHDNAWPHTDQLLQQSKMSFECLPHPPDLAPSDFHVFGPLKEAVGGKSFRSNEEVQQAVHEWLHSQPKDFFFLEISMHFRSAGTLVWNAMETT